jgi:hypothetical protein
MHLCLGHISQFLRYGARTTIKIPFSYESYGNGSFLMGRTTNRRFFKCFKKAMASPKIFSRRKAAEASHASHGRLTAIGVPYDVRKGFLDPKMSKMSVRCPYDDHTVPSSCQYFFLL